MSDPITAELALNDRMYTTKSGINVGFFEAHKEGLPQSPAGHLGTARVI